MDEGSNARSGRRKRLLSVLLFVLVFGGITAAAVVFRHELWALFTEPERLRAWVSSFHALAPLVFVGIQALQVVVFVIPGEVPQIAGGYLFGVLQGSLLSVAGIGIGSAICFWLARALGVPFVQAFFDAAQIGKLRSLADSPRSRIVFFLLFVIPGIPKDILCYVAGLSSMRFLGFFLISLAGRIPGIVGSALMGSAAAAARWRLALIVAGVAIALFVAGYLLRGRISERLERLARRPNAQPEEPERKE
jgi:uncharacterized membrane protein YdjX (TVP38/TMEM64 family)